MNKAEVEKMSNPIAVKQYFEMTFAEMREEYTPLSPELRDYFGNGAKAELLKVADD